MYRLLFEDRLSSREPFVTQQSLLYIGRDAICTLRLTENGVGDRHAVIERREDGYYARDLGSANGTHVNGQRIGSQRLASGDELEVGSVRFRFEIVQEPPIRRRSVDLLLALAVVVVVGTMAGQIALLYWIFSQSRPHHVRTDTGRLPAPSQAMPAASSNAALPLAASVAPAPLPPAVSMPSAPSVLNRRIKIQRVDRKDEADGVTLQLRIVAQVGERTLDPTAIALMVEFVGAGEGKSVPVSVPADWENFATRVLTARYAGTPKQLRGYVVRTYYRGELQDVVSVPPGLAAAGPPPL